MLHRTCLLTICSVATMMSSARRLGGFSEERPVNPDDILLSNILDSIKPDFVGQSGLQYPSAFRGISYRTQVVAGTNYIIKVEIGNGKYAHLRIFNPLPQSTAGPQLEGFQLNKKLKDRIEIFSTPMPLAKQLLSGLSDQPEYATEETQALVDLVKDDYAGFTGVKPVDFTAISYKKQTFAGTNYFVKVRISGSNYSHLRIYQPPPSQGKAQLVGYELHKKLADSIEVVPANIPTTTPNHAPKCVVTKCCCYSFIVTFLLTYTMTLSF